MEPEAVLNLFNSFWFYLKIFEKQSNTSTSSNPEPNPGPEIQENPSKPKVSSQLSIHSRSKSDHTILSDGEISLEIPKPPQLEKPGKNIERKTKRFSKSLSELEFEEVKGFMDLGFVFSEEDKDSSLVEIIPGLQRLGERRDCGRRKHEETSVNVKELPEQGVRRPYLSEAWEISKYRQKGEDPLTKWRVPAVSNEIEMKDSLKCWAQTVASAVR